MKFPRSGTGIKTCRELSNIDKPTAQQRDIILNVREIRDMRSKFVGSQRKSGLSLNALELLRQRLILRPDLTF